MSRFCINVIKHKMDQIEQYAFPPPIAVIAGMK
jgi:hypothetical protein